MQKMVFVGFAALIVATAANAQSMNAEVFHGRAAALQKKGALALFSGDMKRLLNEAKAASQRARGQRLAAAKAGQRPRYCPPEGKYSMNSSEFMSRLGTIPQADRTQIDMTEAMNRIFAQKFPCPTA